MNSKFKDHLVERLAQNPLKGLARVHDDSAKQAKELFSAHAIADLERRYAALVGENGHHDATAHAIGNISYSGNFKTQAQFERHAKDHLVTNLNRTDLALEIHLGMGDRLICAPYDVDWGVGSSSGSLASSDGKAWLMASGKGFSGAGVGFFLTTDEPVLAAVTPQGIYKWAYTAFEDLWSSSTEGGLVMLVYDVPNPKAIAENRVDLWSQHGLRKMAGQSGGGQIAQAKSPSFTPFGTLPLAPLRFNMYPGHQYLVWFYCWEMSFLEKQGPFIGTMSFDMPCVSIHAGPQFNPPR